MTARSAPSDRRVAIGLALLAGWSTLPSALAEPLPKEQCDSLVAERALLEGGGAGENIVRGPEWGKSNLTKEQIDYIRRLIAVREELLFRCRTYEAAVEAPPPSSAPADAPAPGRKPVTAPAAGKDGVPPPERPKRVEAKATPNDESAVERKPVGAGPKKSPPQAKKAAKPKHDDALKLRGTLAVPNMAEPQGGGGAPQSSEPPPVPAKSPPARPPAAGPDPTM